MFEEFLLVLVGVGDDSSGDALSDGQGSRLIVFLKAVKVWQFPIVYILSLFMFIQAYNLSPGAVEDVVNDKLCAVPDAAGADSATIFTSSTAMSVRRGLFLRFPLIGRPPKLVAMIRTDEVPFATNVVAYSVYRA